jgi:hypothetical protein
MIFTPLAEFLVTLALGLTIPAAAVAGALVARPWWRLLGVIVGVAVAFQNGTHLPHSYPALHLLTAFLSAILVGASLVGAQIPPLLAPGTRRAPVTMGPQAAPNPARWRAQTAIVAPLAFVGAASLIVPPSNEVLVHLLRFPGAALTPFLGVFRGEPADEPAPIPEEQREWFVDRAAHAPIPPSAPSLLPEGPIVILIGVDSMRAELLTDDAHRSRFPEIFRLRDESTHFTDARSAGSSTVPSLVSLFAGDYYSSIHWLLRSETADLVFPFEDTTPRFPESLSAAGIPTVTFDGTSWLLNHYGIVRGFTEEQTLRKGGGFVSGDKLVTPLRERLRTHGRGPLFAFVHLLDAHYPYTSAGTKSSPFEGYLAELGAVDEQLRRLREELTAAKLLDRTCLIVMADHGEAFGERGVTGHALTLYDELVRVPLLVRLPGGKPRVVTDRVSLVDLGPTILDLMGVPTPGRFMGQSLVGYLRGGSPKLTRPIVAEARLKQSMITLDGFKIIHDTRTRSVELYDLKSDPREERNLYREGSAGGRLSMLRAFFELHTFKMPGYKVPYRRW